MTKNLDYLLELADLTAGRINDWIAANELILVSSHLDADGLSAAGIIGTALARRQARFQLRITRQLDQVYLSEIATQGVGHFIFCDLGSGQLALIKESLANSEVVILDHHPPSKEKLPTNIGQLNPHECGYDATYEISGAGVAYLSARHLGGSNSDLAALAVVGALGDIQDRGKQHDLVSLNRDIIVEDAVAAGVLDRSIDLRIFGRETRPIHIALQYSSDPYIPGISNDPEGALNFLADLDIELRQGEEWRSIASLSKDEKRQLNSSLITYMLKQNIPPREAQSLIGVVFTLIREEKGSYLRDARMFSTLLNATGRSNQGGIGVAICMGERDTLYRKAEVILKEYREQLALGLQWLTEDSQAVVKHKLIQTFHAENRVPDTIVGNIAGMALNSRLLDWSKPVIAFVYSRDGRVKVSARTTVRIVEAGADLGEAMKQATEEIGSGSEGGGHNIAAGATIPRGQEERFIQIVERILRKQLGRMKAAQVSNGDNDNEETIK
ncbi:MAG: DHHA1 domain-containing protein [Candidatus Thorarchaeota archaeon]